MPLPRSEVIPGYLDELDRLEQVIRGLGDAEWATPTRCDGWNVADVCAHVVGTLVDVANMNIEPLGDPAYLDEMVERRRGQSQLELADELATARKAGQAILEGLDDEAWYGPPLAPVSKTLGDGVTTLWYDTYVHLDDISAALGRPSERGPGLRVALVHLADILDDHGWGPGTLAPEGMEPIPVRGGGGPAISGDPLQLLLAGTGRLPTETVGADPAFNVYR